VSRPFQVVPRIDRQRRITVAQLWNYLFGDVQPVGIAVGKGPQQNAIHERKNCRRRADAEGQDENCRKREAAFPSQDAQTKS